MILITWWGLPQYAARAIGAFVKSTSEEVRIISTRPVVPIKGMEDLVGCPIKWVGDEESRNAECGRLWLAELGELPRIMIVGNWNLAAYKVLEDAVRAGGGKTVAVSDANYVIDWKQLIRKIRFCFGLKRRFDYFFVPGKSGRKLMRFYGIPDERIYEGLYAADQNLFKDETSINHREKKIIYVGQFIERKNVMRLVEAFKLSKIFEKGWKIEFNGSGILENALKVEANDYIVVNGFVQPEQLAAKYQEARCLVLPSLEEHWGVVVHEAALCGCYMLLSKGIGAADDFATSENAGVFDPLSVEDMSKAMKRMAEMSDDEMRCAERISSKLGLAAGTQKFVENMKAMVTR